MRRALLTLLLVIVGAIAPGGAPAGAVVTEVLPGPVGYFSLATPAPAQAVTLASGTASTLTVANTAGVPDVTDLAAVAINVTVANPATSSALRVWANGTTEPTSYAMQFTAASTQSTLVTTEVGSDRKIALKTPATGSTPVSVVVVGFYAKQQPCYGTGCRYHNRFVEARGTTIYDGLPRPGSAGEVLTEATSSAAPRTFTIHGAAGVPATATKTVLRVSAFPVAAVTSATVNVRQRGGPLELAGILTVTGTSTVTKMVTTQLGAAGADLGKVDLYIDDPGADDTAQFQVVVDVVGYLVGSAYTPVATAADPAGVPSYTVAHGTPTTFDARALAGLPSAYSTFYYGAVVLDVSVSGATKAGSVSFGAGVPHVSFGPGQSTSNQVMVPIKAVSGPTNLSVSYTATTGGTGSDTVQVTLTPIGAYLPGSYPDPTSRLGDLFTPLAPTQIHTSVYVWDAAGTTVTLPVLGVAGVPATGVSRVALQVQSRNNVGATSVTFGPNGRPLTGDPQLTTDGQRTSTRVLVDVGPDGKVKFKVGLLKSTVDVSIVGWYSPYAGNGAQPDSVAIYGDSITVLAGSDVMTAIEDTHRLGALGASGFKAEALGWWADSIAASRPDQVVVNLGTNDAWLLGPTAAQTRASVVDQLAAFTTATCRWVVTVNAQTTPSAPYPGRAAAIDTEYRALPAPGNRIGLIDWDAYVADYVATTGPITDMIGDGIHPTPAGLTALAGLYEAAVTGTANTFVTPCS